MLQNVIVDFSNVCLLMHISVLAKKTSKYFCSLNISKQETVLHPWNTACMYVCVCVCVCVCVHVCMHACVCMHCVAVLCSVCVRETERERGRETETERNRQTEKSSILIIEALTVILTLKIASTIPPPSNTLAHDDAPLYHVWLQNKMLRGSDDIIHTKPKHMDRWTWWFHSCFYAITQIILWPWVTKKWPTMQKEYRKIKQSWSSLILFSIPWQPKHGQQYENGFIK